MTARKFLKTYAPNFYKECCRKPTQLYIVLGLMDCFVTHKNEVKDSSKKARNRDKKNVTDDHRNQ